MRLRGKWLWWCVLLVDCHTDDISSVSALCPMTPTNRDGESSLACRENAECPAGTACTRTQSPDGEFSVELPCSDAEQCACRPERFPAAAKDQLLRGFGGDEFDLVVTPGQPSQFSWIQPHGATSVTCGLFVAVPDVQGGARGHIRNDSQALYRTHRFRLDDSARTAQQVAFHLADLRTPHDPKPCEASSRLQPSAAAPAYPIVSTLRVGCWASDTSGVIAATQLQDVSPSDIPETSLPVTVCAGAEQDVEGRYCYPRASTGICQAGVCRALPAQAVPASTKQGSLGGSGGQGSTDESGGASAGESPMSAAPVDHCQAQPDDTLCKRDSDFKFGRCIAGFCNPEPNSSPTLDFPLLVSSCAPEADKSADTNWLNCLDASMQGFGTCLEGRCRSRCLNGSDCGEGESRVCFGQIATTHELDCLNRQEPTALGVCVTAAEVTKLCRSE